MVEQWHGNVDMEQCLGANAAITNDPIFERAVVKIQSPVENTLTVTEARTVKGYLLAATRMIAVAMMVREKQEVLRLIL